MPLTTEPMTAEDLAAIRRRLRSVGLFAAHAYTDVRRLLAEVDRCHAEVDRRHAEQAAAEAMPGAA